MADELPPKKNELATSWAGEDHELMSEDDCEALAKFCGNVPLDELSFSAWSELHRSLDLTLSLRLSRAEALAGGKRIIDYVRTTVTLSPTGDVAQRKKERIV